MGIGDWGLGIGIGIGDRNSLHKFQRKCIEKMAHGKKKIL
jgi:hypothetical protein